MQLSTYFFFGGSFVFLIIFHLRMECNLVQLMKFRRIYRTITSSVNPSLIGHFRICFSLLIAFCTKLALVPIGFRMKMRFHLHASAQVNSEVGSSLQLTSEATLKAASKGPLIYYMTGKITKVHCSVN